MKQTVLAGVPSGKPKPDFPRRRDGYYHYNGKKYVSVTSVLECLAKHALIPWAAKTAASLVLDDPFAYDTAEKAAAGIYQARDKAADRGSMVHSLAESLGRGAEIVIDDLPPHVQGYAKAFRSFVSLVQPEILFTEANVYSDKHGYAGTTDHIARWNDGLVHEADFKTGKTIYRESALQLCAYRNSDFILTKAGEKIPLLGIDSTDVVLLREDGTFLIERTDAPFDVFLNLLKVWEWQKEAR